MSSKVPVDLYASVGGGDQAFLATVEVPITSKGGESGELVIDLRHQFIVMRNSIERYTPKPEDPRRFYRVPADQFYALQNEVEKQREEWGTDGEPGSLLHIAGAVVDSAEEDKQ